MRDWRQVVMVGLKFLLPLVTLAASIGVSVLLYRKRPESTQKEVVEVAPVIAAIRLERRTVCFPIQSQGTVRPRRETILGARVAGEVEWVAECFDGSGFFQKGELLARIDRRDYALGIQRLEASQRSAQAHLRDAQQQLKRQQSLTQSKATTQASLQQAEATAEMAAAAIDKLAAELAEARNAATDTQIIAPFDGCIQEQCVEVGQFVTVGTKLASCFATDAVEVRLPVSDDNFAFLGIQLGAGQLGVGQLGVGQLGVGQLGVGQNASSGPAVELSTDFAGRKCNWVENIIRSEAIVDSRSRMVYLVAQVKAPYSNLQLNGGQPLAVGMFVEATIRCPPKADVVVLPESCVNNSDQIFVVNSNGRLELVQITTIWREQDWIVARGDVQDGVTVCATPLENAIPGMAVQIHGEVASVLVETDGAGGIINMSEQIELATRLKRTER